MPTGIYERKEKAPKPCPNCGTINPTDFDFRYYKRQNREYRNTYCRVCDSKRWANNSKKNGGSKIYHDEYVYGLVAGQKELILKSQNGCCGICGVPFLPKERICIEHNHDTNKIRGLVHTNCNTGLRFIENKIFLSQCLSWLEKHNG